MRVELYCPKCKCVSYENECGCKAEKRFVLEFEEEPTFLYVSHGSKNEQIFLHGKEVQNWTGLKLETDMESFMNYDISYIDVPKREE